MKKQNKLWGSALLAVAALGAAVVYATVGGPTLIYDFRYNPADESVYYIEQDSGGRGCPPELLKLSLNTGKSEAVISCDDGEALIRSGSSELNPVAAAIAAITGNLKYLNSIGLKENDITVDVNFTRVENFPPESNSLWRRHFTATVYQRGAKVAELPIAGCNLEQPFTFAGYAITGFDKKIALLVSTKGDCFEGGYTNETLHVVGGVGDLDKDFGYNSMKWNEALAPNEGTLVVFEEDEIGEVDGEAGGVVDGTGPDAGKDETEKERSPFARGENSSATAILLTAAAALLLGFALGRLSRRRPAASAPHDSSSLV